MKPGTRVRFNGKCSWDERVGAEGVVVDPAVFEGRYPADKRDPRRIIVLLDNDPLVPAPADPRWTCATTASSLDVLEVPDKTATNENRGSE